MRHLVALMALFGVFALAGCNTVKGVGEDMEQAGSKISQTAEDTKQKM
ncbi:entericidin A/B family lipoprotein [Suttonella sp. R2A3]|nr:entericidin A/B family lipoprotein [Suttonella sp. R2A3]UJF23827.1 entericidin A/B family lipoprotein [Suttonella sp. R2A3]